VKTRLVALLALLAIVALGCLQLANALPPPPPPCSPEYCSPTLQCTCMEGNATDGTVVQCRWYRLYGACGTPGE
jgi:hypothetical protein